MAPKKKMAPIGKYPIDATTAYGIQSKAVFKYNHYLGHLISQNFEIIFITGVEACKG